MDVSVTLAAHVTGVEYKDIPDQAIGIAKKDILDTLGAGLAGTSQAGTKELVGLVTHWAGKEESTILGFGNRVPTLNAALVNATMARAVEFDSVYHTPPVHGSASILPAAIAMAEEKGRVSGRDLLTAVTLGLDVMVRIALAPRQWFGWSLAAICAYFGAAAAAGKLLGLNEDKMVNAFGIAYSQATGEHQSMHDDALSKRLSQGLAAKGGVLAALLAERGFTGARNSLEGRSGLYNMFWRGEYDVEKITGGLGKEFKVVNTGFKPYPCGGATHASIDATLSIVGEHNIAPAKVEKVSVELNSMLYNLMCEPREMKQNPRTGNDARFSLPYTIATAIIDRKVGLDQFTDDAVKRPSVIEMARKVIPVIDPETKPLTPEAFRAKVEIWTKDGRVHSRRVDIPRGGPKYPMTTEELFGKFRDCAAHAAMPLPKANIEKVIGLVSRLELVEDVSVIMKLLSG